MAPCFLTEPQWSTEGSSLLRENLSSESAYLPAIRCRQVLYRMGTITVTTPHQLALRGFSSPYHAPPLASTSTILGPAREASLSYSSDTSSLTPDIPRLRIPFTAALPEQRHISRSAVALSRDQYVFIGIAGRFVHNKFGLISALPLWILSTFIFFR